MVVYCFTKNKDGKMSCGCYVFFGLCELACIRSTSNSFVPNTSVDHGIQIYTNACHWAKKTIRNLTLNQQMTTMVGKHNRPGNDNFPCTFSIFTHNVP